jgi:dienelactone hydrolase
MRQSARLSVLGVVAAAMLPLGAQAGESVTYSVGGAEFEGYNAPAMGDSKGLVLIIHDWDGLTDYEEKRAEMLAEMGYDAFAVDLFGKGNRPADVDARRAETGKLYSDREKMRSLLMGGLAAARERSAAPAVVMGYCFGGAAVLEMARSGQAEEVAGYATFHGGLATPEGQSYPASTPPLLIAHGGADTAITMDEVADLSKELEVGGLTYQIEVYSGAPHAFTVFGSQAYRETADRQSWQAFQDFLASTLTGS